ncbi:hypothetical protein ABGB14_12885 [Nonomuraea sp. B10E15]|uniref:hypothetical protein n=1 Tax=Nonomuraea sp. B10E15 TaxID=3153560 RepID=UPI00325D4ECC
MFSASNYAAQRYESEAGQEHLETLQVLVHLAGLEEEDEFVTAVLNGVTYNGPEGNLASDMESIRTALAEASAIYRLGDPWRAQLKEFAVHLGEDDYFSAQKFYEARSFSPDHTEVVGGRSLQFATPMVLAHPPIVEVNQHLRGALAGYAFQPPTIWIRFGLFKVLTALKADGDNTDATKAGVLQFVTSSRVAEYDGLKVDYSFERSLDTSQPPWYKGQTDDIPPGEPVVLIRDDSPTWAVPTKWQKGQDLRSVTITDTFETYLAVQVGPQAFTTLFTCEWTFHAKYDMQKPGEGSAEYSITAQKIETRDIKVTGLPLAHNVEAKVVS